MTEELKELGLNVGHRRVGRLMRENGISVVRTRKYKATTDSNYRFNIAPNLLKRDFAADAPNQKWAGERHLNNGACNTARPPHNMTNQMSHTQLAQTASSPNLFDDGQPGPPKGPRSGVEGQFIPLAH